jgi:hypothetical protein
VLSVLRLYQYEHRVFQQREREGYYSKRLLAAKHPDRYLSLICDGMQQATTALPAKVCSSVAARSLIPRLLCVLWLPIGRCFDIQLIDDGEVVLVPHR